MLATLQHGALVAIPDCYIDIPGSGKLEFKVLPEISDSKSAAYNDEPVIGRASPIKTYSHSENRAISMKIHFVSLTDQDVTENLRSLRGIQSALYPIDDAANAPYLPPPVCRLRCGETLSKQALCVVLKNYSVSFPTNVVWKVMDDDTKLVLPLQFDVDTTWDVVYDSRNLPGNNMILNEGGS